jgi:alkanesulfonate monooxygenase SsuD/methylene tetrahydromethanopterin reductase-like flavin-dependent oxidoreductase (luciferase family)
LDADADAFISSIEIGAAFFAYRESTFQVKDLPLAPRPVQEPHPPIRIAANSPDTFAIAGQLRLQIFASPLINPPDKLREYLSVHRENLKNEKQDGRASVSGARLCQSGEGTPRVRKELDAFLQ